MYASLISSNSQCTVQIIHKLHLAPGNKQHHETLSCFVAQSTSLPVAKEKCLSLCLVWLVGTCQFSRIRVKEPHCSRAMCFVAHPPRCSLLMKPRTGTLMSLLYDNCLAQRIVTITLLFPEILPKKSLFCKVILFK